MRPVRFFMPGCPVGKQRRVVWNGKSLTPMKTRQFERSIGQYAIAHGALAHDGPVRLTVVIHMAPPPSWPEWKTKAALSGMIRPTGRPDISNVLKAIEDGMNGIAYNDDAQIIDVMVSKRYTAQHGVSVEVVPLPMQPSSITRKAQCSDTL